MRFSFGKGFGRGRGRGFGRAAARLARRNNRSLREARRPATQMKMPTRSKPNLSEAALRKKMAQRVRQRASSKPVVMQQARQKAPKPQFEGAQQAKQVRRKRQFNDPRMYSGGGSVIKSSKGHTDYRKTGYTLSTVDNRKKK